MASGRFFGLAAVVGALAVELGGAGAPAAAMQSDAQIRRAIIQASIRAYPSSCPCPYSVDRAGRRCGGRSAYSRPGGYAPKCYPDDVTAADIREWRGR